MEVIDCLVDLVLRYEGPYKSASNEGGIVLAVLLSLHLLLVTTQTCPWYLSHINVRLTFSLVKSHARLTDAVPGRAHAAATSAACIS